MAPPDRYKSFAELNRAERERFSFVRLVRKRRSPFAILAPHGGGIEPGTTEIARAIAGLGFSFYALDGIKSSGNDILHITSTRFDEPKCLALVRDSQVVVAVHGCAGKDAFVYVGGLHAALAARLAGALKEIGVEPRQDGQTYAGLQPDNICNRGRSGKGVQLEISEGLRRMMFRGLKREEREETTPVFRKFVLTVRKTLRAFAGEMDSGAGRATLPVRPSGP
jgi:phage replication-related protein YjqB (UPF0714/DUF867 family)